MATRRQTRKPEQEQSGQKALLKALLADPEGYFRWNARRAAAGDVSSAEEMLHGFCEAVEEGRSVPEAIRQYLLIAFSHYLSGCAPIAKALKLIGPTHRPPGSKTFDSVRAVATLFTCS